MPPHTRIPKGHPVQPLKPGQPAKDRTTCGHCGLSWDDGEITSLTPAPSGRCPFESFHVYQDEESPEPNPKKREGWADEQIRKWSGAHVLLYAGDGHGRPKELIFSSSDATESAALCRTVLRLLEDRISKRCPDCLDVPGKDGLGRTCKRCKGAGRIPREHQ